MLLRPVTFMGNIPTLGLPDGGRLGAPVLPHSDVMLVLSSRTGPVGTFIDPGLPLSFYNEVGSTFYPRPTPVNRFSLFSPHPTGDTRKELSSVSSVSSDF